MVHMKIARHRLPNAKYILKNTFFWEWGRVQGGESGRREKFQKDRKKYLAMMDTFIIMILVMISWVYSHVKTYQLYT